MLLTTLFWICSFLPGYALARRSWPGAHEAGLLSVLAFSVLGTFVLLSPVSIACYAFGAPLWIFSIAHALAAVGGGVLLVRARAHRELSACARREPIVAWLALAALLGLQARVGGYLAGDATFHVGRVRVLLEHGFTNRDIYLADYYFQHIYHTNLLYPIYASLSQLTGQTYLEAWFYSQVWAKLLVAAGHYVLGFGVTRNPLAAWLLALTVITANAGETYTVYPNTLAVGWLIPLALGAGYSLLADDAHDTRLRQAVAVAAASFVMGQVHGLYALYAGLVLAPALAIAVSWPKLGRRRGALLLALVGMLAGAPFLLVSQYGFRPGTGAASVGAASGDGASESAGPAVEPAPAPPKRWPDVNKGRPAVLPPALAVGGGHLEKTLELDSQTGEVWFAPHHMGGRGFVALGFAGLVLAFARSRGRRGPLAAAGLGAVLLAVGLFVPRACTFALEYLQQPFTVARLSTVLSSLLLLGVSAALAEVVRPIAAWSHLGKLRWLPETLALLLVVGAATRLTGHAPVFFPELVRTALAPREQRFAVLELLETRRELLAQVVPPGATVLTTARFARSLVMICDCYVIIADRGHTYLAFARDRRNELLKLHGSTTAWHERLELLRRYKLKLVVFESRHLNRLYRWTREHGRVIGEAAGLRVVELRDG